jgi:hypothetical protein
VTQRHPPFSVSSGTTEAPLYFRSLKFVETRMLAAFFSCKNFCKDDGPLSFTDSPQLEIRHVEARAQC